MASSGVHAIVVWGDEDVDAEGIWGVLSDSDFIAAAAEGFTSAEEAVVVAGARVVRVGADESLTAAADLMRANAGTHLVVVSDQERPVGFSRPLMLLERRRDSGERRSTMHLTVRKGEDHGQDCARR